MEIKIHNYKSLRRQELNSFNHFNVNIVKHFMNYEKATPCIVWIVKRLNAEFLIIETFCWKLSAGSRLEQTEIQWMVP